MKYQVKYSKAAVRDLDRVWFEVFEASKDLRVTEEYISELMDKIEAKALFPESGAPLYYEDAFTGYRFVVFKSYIAFYRIEQSSVLFDRILFARSDYLKTLRLSPDEEQP